jgi:ParB family chromosome partitioning protein
LARPDFRGAAARRLSEERELSPAIISLLAPEGTTRATGVRRVPVERIDPNPDQPRLAMDQEGLKELAASVKEHGVLQPILVRPLPAGRYQVVAGERRWRASRIAGLDTIPAMIEEIDDDTALEIALIENLQREDLSPLDEATMYERMTRDHGYSVRKLAQKLGKDKGYIENRLRLANAPAEVRDLVSLRKDTVSHAYELLKVEDPRKRKRLAEQVARGELSLAKLRSRVDILQGVTPEMPGGRRGRRAVSDVEPVEGEGAGPDGEVAEEEAGAGFTPPGPGTPMRDDALVSAKAHINDSIEELVWVLRTPAALDTVGDVDRANLAKYLTIAKLKLENAIAILRSGEH